MPCTSTSRAQQVERLSSRMLLDGEFAFLQPDGELVVLGTSERAIIRVEADSSLVRAIVNGKAVSFPAANVESLYIDAMDRADVVVNATDLPAIIGGGQGDDTLTGGTGSDTIFGDSGNDVIDAGAGDDELYPGLGNDVVTYESFPEGTFAVAQFGADFLPVQVSYERVSGVFERDVIDALDVETIRATAGDDVINVDTSGPFLVDGGAGNDFIRGSYRGQFLIPDNSVAGGAGDDTIAIHADEPVNGVDAGEGDDLIFDSFGNSSVHRDAMQLDGGPGNDTVLIGGDSNSHLNLYHTPPGIEVVHHRGQFGFTLIGNELDNILIAGDGSEFSPVTINGAGGNDLIVGTLLDDVLEGGDGSDTLRGGPGADHLLGGDGDDWLLADADGAPDTLDGGGGFDRVLTLSSNGNDVLLNVERVMPARLSRLSVDVLFPDLFPPAALRSAGEAIGSPNGRVGPDGPISR